MRTHVTVVPIDQLIIVEGEPLFFPFTAPSEIHAIQWHNQSSHIEYTDGRFNRPLAAEDYDTEVAPYVSLWEAEKERLALEDAEANRPPTEEEALVVRIQNIDLSFSELEQAAIRPTMSITLALAQGATPAPEDVAKIAEIDAQKAALREERAALQARLDELQSAQA